MIAYRGSEAQYEAARAAVDAICGWPDEGTATSIEPAETAPRDGDGRCVVVVSDWLLAVAGVADTLNQLLERAQA